MSDYISREAVCYQLAKQATIDGQPRAIKRAAKIVEDFPAADVREVPSGGIGEMSDGYHTFNGLYYQRMVLFAALVNACQDRAWKSYKHEDGELCFGGGWFIVGIDTPQGSYTYHYENKDFDLFDCVELPVAKHWDGHTEEDVTRLLSLPDGVGQALQKIEGGRGGRGVNEYCEWYEKHITDLTENEREMCPGYGRSCLSCAYIGEAEEGE